MKLLSLKKAFILAVLGLFVTVRGAASSAASSSLQSSTTDSPSSSERRHAQFIMFIDDGLETPDTDHAGIGAITLGFARAAHGYYGQSIPFLVSDSLIFNFIVRNLRGTSRYPDINHPIDWSAWDIFKVEGTKLTLFVPRDYAQMHPNHGLLLGSSYLRQLPAYQESLFAFFNKGTFNKTLDWAINIFKKDILVKHFPIEPLQPNQLRKIFRVRDYSETVDAEQDDLPIWDIIIAGHGNLALYSSFRPQKTAKIAGISADAMQGLLKFFNKELRMGTLLILSCSAGGENINLLQFDQAVGNDTLLNLNFTVIVSAIADSVAYSQPPAVWSSFFVTTAQEKSLGNLVKALGVQTVQPGSPHGTNNIPQVWVPGGYGFQTFQVDAEIKVLSKALVRAKEDEGLAITIPDMVHAVLIYPERIGVPLEFIKDLQAYDYSRSGSTLAIDLPAFPIAFDMLKKIIGEQLTPNPSDFPAFGTIDVERFAYTFNRDPYNRKPYPKFISMMRSDDRTVHSLSRIDLKPIVAPLFSSRYGVMQFIRDAFVDLHLQNRSDKIFQIDVLEGPNDLLLLLELVRFKAGGAISDLEMTLRSFLDERITMHNLFVHMGPSSSFRASTVRIGFILAGRAWLLNYDPRKAKSDEIAWKFIERSLEEHMQEYENNRSLLKPSEAKQLSISAALRKRIATEQALARMKARSRGQVQSMFKDVPVSAKNNFITSDRGKVWVNPDPNKYDDSRFLALNAEQKNTARALWRLFREIAYSPSNQQSQTNAGQTGLKNIGLQEAIEEYEQRQSLDALDAINEKYGKETINSAGASAPLRLWIDLAKQGKVPTFANN